MGAVAYLALANPSAKNNLGTLLRCAAAFAVEEVIVVGASKYSTHGAHGSDKHLQCRCFDDWESAASFLRIEKGCDLCGIVVQSQTRSPNGNVCVRRKPPSAPPTGSMALGAMAESVMAAAIAHADENSGLHARGVASSRQDIGEMPAGERAIGGDGDVSGGSGEGTPPPSSSSSSSSRKDPGQKEALGEGGRWKNRNHPTDLSSTSVRSRPFRRSTAFLVGHRNRLEREALELCDFLVHVEQASEFAMDLGAPVTTSIALHHFTSWANYEERHFTGEKFNVDLVRRRQPPLQKAGNPLAEERLRLREERQAADPLGGFALGDAGADGGGRLGLGWLPGVRDDVVGQGDY